MKSNTYVYLTTNNINGMQYIGLHSTNNMKDGYMGSGKIIRRAIKKYGKHNFITTPIAFFNDRDKASEIESKLIKLYNTLQPSGYNIIPGGGFIAGGSGYKHTEETKRKISANSVYTPERRKAISDRHKGKVTSDETKRKMSISATGRKGPIPSEKTRGRLREALKNIKKIICPYCKNEFAPWTIKRHINKCKI